MMRLSRRQQEIVLTKMVRPASTQSELAAGHRVCVRTIKRDVTIINRVIPSLAYLFGRVRA